jgi:hypothetical protein
MEFAVQFHYASASVKGLATTNLDILTTSTSSFVLLGQEA